MLRSGSRYKNAGLLLLTAVIAVAGFLTLKGSWKTDSVVNVNQSEDGIHYQTGKAFEVITPEKQADDSSIVTDNKTPEQLIAEAEQIMLSANQILIDNPIPDSKATAGQGQAVDQQIQILEQKIKNLQTQLQ